jgi:DEAD/DEAH box helicase domain-containing protein
MISKHLGIRRSSVIESSSLAKRWLKTDGQALLFSISRRSVEILFMYLQNRPDLMSRARSYRSGYLPEERRKIEKELRDREIGLVISTNALELGIDIGGLDAVFMNGYPGTISATRQQAGRAGRIGNSSLCVLVASSNPLDQYICQHPDYLFDNNPEQALIAPDHPEILRQQLLCAVHELALLDGEGFGSLGPEHIFPYLKVLEEDGLIHRQRDRWVGKLDQLQRPADWLCGCRQRALDDPSGSYLSGSRRDVDGVRSRSGTRQSGSGTRTGQLSDPDHPAERNRAAVAVAQRA